MVVSVDLGYGWVKAVREDGRRMAFPAVVAPAPRSLGFSEAGSSNAERYRITIAGEQLLIGEAAMAAGGTRGLAEVASDRPGIRSLLLGGLSLLCGDAEGPIDVLLGLPVSAFAHRDERLMLQSAFGGFAETVGGRTVRIGRVEVYPQGAGAFVGAAQRNAALRGGLTGIVDVGHWTTDYLVVSADGGLKVQEGAWGSIPAGMAEVLRDIQKALETRLHRSPDPLRLELAVRDGQPYRHQGQPIPLVDMLHAATAGLAARLRAALQDAWRRELSAMDRILLSGGGAMAVAEHLSGLHPRIVLAAESQWANAEGYLVLQGAGRRGAGVA